MVTPRFAPEIGGVEHHVGQVARRMAASGCEVTVLTADPGGALAPREQGDGFAIRRVRAWPAGSDYRFAPRIWREVSQGGWDIVHVQSYHTFVAPIAMLAARRARIPYVVTFHGGGHTSAVRHGLRARQRRLLAPLLRGAARLIAIARFEITDYGGELGLGPDRFTLIPIGVDLVDPATLPDRDEDAPRPLIASIGRLERYKGHHRIIAALPFIVAEHPHARLWIAGEGPYEQSLSEQARELGLSDRVLIEAVRDRAQMAARVQQADLVVLLSDFETQPSAVLEAANLRRPVLVADNSGLRELADQGLARAIATDSPPARVADAALEMLGAPPPQQVPDIMSWEACTAALIELYREVSAGAG